MTLPFPAIDAIFNRPRDVVAVLFLTEDSGYVFSLWQRLRELYLPLPLNAIKSANLSTSVLPLLPVVVLQAEMLWMPHRSAPRLSPHLTPPPTEPRAGTTSLPLTSVPTVETPFPPANVTRAVEAPKVRFCRTPDLALGIIGSL